MHALLGWLIVVLIITSPLVLWWIGRRQYQKDNFEAEENIDLVGIELGQILMRITKEYNLSSDDVLRRSLLLMEAMLIARNKGTKIELIYLDDTRQRIGL